MQFHPQLPPRRIIQSLSQTTIGSVLEEDHSLTIAFSRAPNLGDRLWSTRLITNPGDGATNVLTSLASVASV